MFQKSFLELRGRPRVPRRWPPARLTAYLQCPVRRPDRLHIYRVGGPRAPSHLVNMQSICSAADRGLEGAQTELFPLLGGSRRARRGPKKSFENQRGQPRCPPARVPAFLQGPSRALGRPLLRGLGTFQNSPAEDLTRRWAVGPANYYYYYIIIIIIIIIIFIIVYLLPRYRRPIVGWSAWRAGE